MKSLKTFLLFSFLLVAALAAATPAHAEKGGYGHGKNKGGHSHSHDGGDEVNVNISINTGDRTVLSHYMVEEYRTNCPPGLAKKRNGCLPPGQAKKHYVMGRRLPDYVVFEPVPRAWLVELQPVPVGYRYVRVDNDVLLMSEATHHIVDAITLMSAVGN